MRLLVGLGNPGPKYVATRHNFGFLLLDRVAEMLAADSAIASQGETPGLGKWLHFRKDDKDLVLLWPLTFMNLSGQALEKLLEIWELPEEFSSEDDILVAIDDLSLPLGRVRIRNKGSSGGHNGLKSVEAHLGHAKYSRLKLGIGRPGENETVIDYVLQPFGTPEQKVLGEVLDFVSPKAIAWLEGASVGDLSQSVNGWLSASLQPKPEKAEERCIAPE